MEPKTYSGRGGREVYKIVARILLESKHAIAFTGAGVSTASGIPDFRGPQGLWKKVDPSLFEISNFILDPLPAWRLFAELYKATARARPNPAHYALAALESMGVLKAVITQNVDGLHQRAGSKRVIELHGNPSRAVCLSCGKHYPIEEALEQVRLGRVPRCPNCGGLLKPDVTFFGEPLPERELQEAMRLAFQSDAVIVVGSSLVVRPANEIPWIVKSRGGRLVIVNVGDTAMDHLADLKIEEPAERALPLICEEAAVLLGRRKELCWRGST
ncbi:MAG: NAD-dependent protein deacylase [Desulfurococcales archaeon]|nr:NAD-dependent protein deacylase [Desulfurococcales archaeon]